MPRQELIFLKNWSKPGHAMKADPVPCPHEPSRIWTLFREEDETKPPTLPIVPVHRVNAFSEDYVHDWNWRRPGRGPAMLDYFSRIADGPVWILLEFDTEEEKEARKFRREELRSRLRKMQPGSVGAVAASGDDLEAIGFKKVEPPR
jgi:hypothetical protein